MLKMTLIERIDSAEKRSEVVLETNNHEQVMTAIVGLFAFFGVTIPQDALIPHGETIRGKFAEMAKLDQVEAKDVTWMTQAKEEIQESLKEAARNIQAVNQPAGWPPSIQETIEATVKEIEDQGGVVTSIKIEDGRRQADLDGRMTYSMAEKLGPLLGALQGGVETAATAAAEERGITVPGDENPLHQPEIEVPGIKVEPTAAEPDPAETKEDINAPVEGMYWPFAKYRDGTSYWKCRYYCPCGHKANHYIEDGQKMVKCFECKEKLAVRPADDYEQKRLQTKYMATQPFKQEEEVQEPEGCHCGIGNWESLSCPKHGLDKQAADHIAEKSKMVQEQDHSVETTEMIQEEETGDHIEDNLGMITQEVQTPMVTIQIGTTTKGKQNEQPPEGSGWKLRKCQTMHKCDDCGEQIKFAKMDGAKHDEYYQKGSSRKRFCPDCFKDKILPRLCVQCHQEKELLMLDDSQGICDDCAQHMSDMAPGGDQE